MAESARSRRGRPCKTLQSQVYTVERVIKQRYNEKKRSKEFLVKWKGFNNSQNTWVEEKNMVAKNGETSKDDTAAYEVEKIVDCRFNEKSKREEYLVKWVGYDESQNTWEESAHLDNCGTELRNFLRLQKPAQQVDSPKASPRKSKDYGNAGNSAHEDAAPSAASSARRPAGRASLPTLTVLPKLSAKERTVEDVNRGRRMSTRSVPPMPLERTTSVPRELRSGLRYTTFEKSSILKASNENSTDTSAKCTSASTVVTKNAAVSSNKSGRSPRLASGEAKQQAAAVRGQVKKGEEKSPREAKRAAVMVSHEAKRAAKAGADEMKRAGGTHSSEIKKSTKTANSEVKKEEELSYSEVKNKAEVAFGQKKDFRRVPSNEVKKKFPPSSNKDLKPVTSGAVKKATEVVSRETKRDGGLISDESPRTARLASGEMGKKNPRETTDNRNKKTATKKNRNELLDASEKIKGNQKVAGVVKDEGGLPSKSASANQADATECSNEEHFDVECIKGERYNAKKQRREFLLKWRGYSDEHNTWEPENYLDCDELIKEYRQRLFDEARRSWTHNSFSPTRPAQAAESSSAAEASTAVAADSSLLRDFSELAIERDKSKKSSHPVARLAKRSVSKSRHMEKTLEDSFDTSSDSEDEDEAERQKRIHPGPGESGIEKGWIPERILTVLQPDGERSLFYVVKYRHKKKVECVANTICNTMWPQVVIRYFERLYWGF